MSAHGVQFKKPKLDFHSKFIKTKLNCVKISQPDNPDENRNNKEGSHCSPEKKPTSFRQLSGSREKTKLFSGKKKVFENKLNTLRSNQRQLFHETSNQNYSDRSVISQADMNQSEIIRQKPITQREPNSLRKNTTEFSQKSFQKNNQKTDICFSAFKAINLKKQNQNISNLVLQKTVSDGYDKQKGLKFKAFPHKRQTLNNRIKTQASTVMPQTPLILEKSKSKNKNEQFAKHTQKIAKCLNNTAFAQNQIKKSSIFSGNQHQTHHIEIDQVMRSREGPLTFDMSPTLY